MAWRNIWRNKRRSLITMASIVFSMLFALSMRSMQEGSYGLMINSVVQSYTGYIQLSFDGYREDKTLEKSMEYSLALEEKVKGNDNIKIQVPRLESFALASTGKHSKGVMLTGIVPQKEDSLTKLSKRVRKGNYLADTTKGVLVGSRLAKFLKINVNDTIILMGQGYHGINASGLYPVVGIVELPVVDLDNVMIYLPLAEAQSFFEAPNMVTTVAIDLKSPNKINRTQRELKHQLKDAEIRVERWDEIMTELMQMIESDRVSGLTMLIILYVIIGFGVFGTLLMMSTERRREFGMMMAIGMRRTKIGLMLASEIALLCFSSIIAGLAITIPTLYIMHSNPIKLTGDMAVSMEAYGWEPIMPFAVEPGFIIRHTLVIMVIVIIAGIIPVVSTMRLKLMKAMKN